MKISLLQLGWNDLFTTHFETQNKQFQEESFVPARVAREDRGAYHVYWSEGEAIAEVTGRFRHNAISRGEYPAVGDWVVMQPPLQNQNARIHALLPRKSSFSRKVAGGCTEEQVTAANIDTVFLVSGLDHNFNLRRIERYVTVAYDSGANPVILLNKADLCDDVESRVIEVQSVACGVAVLVVSAANQQGLSELQPYLGAGTTTAFLGSSGVGKSSLINALLGDSLLAVGAVSEHDSLGRHTTTHRELLFLPQGGVVIDTPGMRELQLWAGEDSLAGTFPEVEELAARCKFGNCQHENEPGCAVRAAVECGELSPDRLASYRKLQGELRYLERKQAHKERLRDWEKKKILEQKRIRKRRKDV